MLEGSFIVTASTIKAGQISLGFFAKLLDMFRLQQVFRIERYGPNYKKEKFLWWTISEEGEKVVLELRGKPAFCQAVLDYLERNPLILSTGVTLPGGETIEGGIRRIR